MKLHEYQAKQLLASAGMQLGLDVAGKSVCALAFTTQCVIGVGGFFRGARRMAALNGDAGAG